MKNLMRRHSAWFLLLAFVGVTAGCNQSYSSPTAPPNMQLVQGAAAVTIVGEKGNMSFSPNPVTARVGQAIQWKNSDGTTHHIVADSGRFDAGIVSGGNVSAAVMVGQPGTYPYHCSIHPSMVGTITVSP